MLKFDVLHGIAVAFLQPSLTSSVNKSFRFSKITRMSVNYIKCLLIFIFISRELLD